MTDDQGKAEALATQFKSEGQRYIPDMLQSPFPVMPDIDFELHRIEKLMKDLNISKATGPDKMPNRALKLVAEQIAPVLSFSFR